MTRSSRIIAVFGANLLLIGLCLTAAGASTPPAFATYQVRLEISRNGVALGAPESRVASGEAANLTLDAGLKGAGMVQQRVTGFPGASDYKALLELELYGPGGRDRIVAPTFGVDLGRAQQYELPTEQGLIRIVARIDGLEAATDGPPADIQTMPYSDL